MPARLLRLVGSRIGPVRLDVILAAALAIGSELERGSAASQGRSGS